MHSKAISLFLAFGLALSFGAGCNRIENRIEDIETLLANAKHLSVNGQTAEAFVVFEKAIIRAVDQRSVLCRFENRSAYNKECLSVIEHICSTIETSDLEFSLRFLLYLKIIAQFDLQTNGFPPKEAERVVESAIWDEIRRLTDKEEFQIAVPYIKDATIYLGRNFYSFNRIALHLISNQKFDQASQYFYQAPYLFQSHLVRYDLIRKLTDRSSFEHIEHTPEFSLNKLKERYRSGIKYLIRSEQSPGDVEKFIQYLSQNSVENEKTIDFVELYESESVYASALHLANAKNVKFNPLQKVSFSKKDKFLILRDRLNIGYELDWKLMKKFDKGRIAKTAEDIKVLVLIKNKEEELYQIKEISMKGEQYAGGIYQQKRILRFIDVNKMTVTVPITIEGEKPDPLPNHKGNTPSVFGEAPVAAVEKYIKSMLKLE